MSYWDTDICQLRRFAPLFIFLGILLFTAAILLQQYIELSGGTECKVIMEDDQKYCRGIIVDLNSLKN